ncbi:MAG: hypothetical protein LLG05_10110 [Porphyromonadaceae bacterium]|nr:hypothetical protein [Porphyromonadaceae bacterium]
MADAGASKGYDASNKPLSTKDGEITGNTFANTGEKAVWLDSTGKGYDNVYIHDNTFINVNVFTNSGHSVSVNITAINASVPTYQNTTGAIIPTKENSELIFSSIFNILNTEFVDNATTKQTAEDFNYQIQETEQGKVAGGIKIVGFNSLIKIENQTYISSPDDVIVKTSIIKNPSLEAWNGGIQSIDKDVNITFKNGTVNATLTAKVQWYNMKRTSSGEEIKKYKTSEYIFTDTYSPAPEVLKQPANITGIIYQYPTYFTLKVPSNGLTKICYEYSGKKSEHTLLVGSKNVTSNGTKLTEYSELEYWKGDLRQQADWVQIPGKLKQNKLNVTAYTPYKEVKVTYFKIIKKEVKEDPIAWWFKPSIGLLVILFFYLKREWDEFRRT